MSKCFFVCTEHPDYPLGKAFGPYSSSADADSAMNQHAQDTRHTDMVKWCEAANGLTEVFEPSGEIAKSLSEESAGCFFICAEHPDYPLGKAFGPYSNEAEAIEAMEQHQQTTNHKDTAILCGNNAIALSSSMEAFSTCEFATRCFCIGDCVKGTGDSSHYRQTVDVDCSLSIEDRKKGLLRAMWQHYLQNHVTDPTDPDAIIADMRQNVRIRCYEVNQS